MLACIIEFKLITAAWTRLSMVYVICYEARSLPQFMSRRWRPPAAVCQRGPHAN